MPGGDETIGLDDRALSSVQDGEDMRCWSLKKRSAECHRKACRTQCSATWQAMNDKRAAIVVEKNRLSNEESIE